MVDAEAARREAAEVEQRVARGERLPLAGVPIAVKDTLATRGLATTAASRLLDGYVPPYDATAVARLKAAGAVLLGKTNCDEFAGLVH
jgi:aspartyl-tRNA(Asn)/glutamyl-tRNA(Gln) amidotransferase subunit A